MDYAALAQLFQEVLIPYGAVGIFLLSFFNSSFSVIPTEVLLVPLVLIEPSNAVYFGVVATVASVLGAGFAHYVGQYGGRPLLERFVSPVYVDRIESWLQTHGYIVVGVSGISPLPFKVFCLASGAFDMDVRRVLGVSLLFRGFRFMTIALLLGWYGDAVVAFIQNRFWLVTSLFGGVILVGYVGWRYQSRIKTGVLELGRFSRPLFGVRVDLAGFRDYKEYSGTVAN